MSDLASQKVLARTSPHLPLSWYFDPKVAEIEKKRLFDRLDGPFDPGAVPTGRGEEDALHHTGGHASHRARNGP